MQKKIFNLLYINTDETNRSSFEKDFYSDFNIITAKSTIDGLRILTKDGIHLIILDYQLPETSGLEFLEEVKKKYPDIKCIILTDHDGIKMVEGYFDSINLWRYILKPYEVTELTVVIKNALEIYQLKIDKDKLLNELNFRVERYEKMMDTAMDSIITINDKHEITEANKAACKLFGYKLKELIGSPLRILIPENKRKAHPKLVKSFSNGEQTSMMMGHDTYRYGLTSSGKKIPIEVSISKQMTGEGNFYNAFIRDVSIRLEKENEIRKSEADLKKAQRITKLGLWSYNIIDDEFSWSDELYRILGMTPNEIKESSDGFYNCVHPDDRDGVRKSYYSSLKKKKSFDINYRLKSPDEPIKYVNEVGEFVFDNNGKAIKSFGTIQDITKQILSEQKVRESENRLKEAQKIAKLGHWTYTISEDKYNWSNELYRILGMSSGKTKETAEIFYNCVHPDDREFVRETDANSLITKKPFNITYRILLSDYSIKYVREIGDFVFDNNGKAIKSFGTIQDITQQIESEIALKNSEKKFRELYEKSGDAILIIKNETFTDCNKATIVMLGYKSKKELLNTHPSKLSPKIQPDGLSSFEKSEEMMSIALEKGTHRFEWSHTKSNGEDFPVEVLLTAISNEPNNKIIHCVWRDITNRKKTEETIIENNLHFSQLADNTSDVFWIGDVSDLEDIKWIYISPAFEQVWQQKAEVLYQDPSVWYRAIHEEDQERMGNEFMNFLLEKIKDYNVKFRIVRPDGTVKYLHATANLVKDHNGKIIRVAGISRDITAQKKTEQELRISKEKIEESEKQFRELYEKSGDAIFILENGENVNCNEAAIVMFNFKSKDAILKTHPSKISPKFQPDGASSYEKSEEMLKIALEKGTHRFEWTHTKSNGEPFPVEVLLTSISNEPSNKVIHAVIRDISERKKAEKALFENNLQFGQLADNTSDVFGVGDVSDLKNIKWLYINPAFERVWQLTTESLYQDASVWFNPIHEEDRKRSITAFMNFVYGENKEYNIKFRIVRTDKTIRYIHATANLIKDHNGKVIRFAGISRDITDQKKHEEKLVEKTTELEESLAILEGKNHELEQFAYIASHDLQEPLSTVSSFAELLEQEYRGKLDEDADTYLQFILDSISRMKKLIHGLLEYSILGKGKTAERVDSNEILSFVLEDLQGAISEKQGKIESGPLPTLNAYSMELRQLFANLIGNALKYSKEGVPPIINISSRKKDSTWEFKFKDNGIGIDEKYYEKIFVIFQRLHNNEDYDGTGIGLAHCRKIVELHNGRIWVESIPNEGSEFYFTIKM